MTAAISSFTMSASNTGNTIVVNSAVFPMSSFASSPIALTVPDDVETAMQVGSASTTPLPILKILVTDEPRSIANFIMKVSRCL